MKKVSLCFSNWKIDEDKKILYKVDSKIVKDEVREKLSTHLKYTDMESVKQYLCGYENCHIDTVIRALYSTLEN